MAAEQEQSPNLLDFNNKQENNGTDNRGRLTAHEFNQLINAVNNNSNDTFTMKKQVGNLSFDVIENAAIKTMESKAEIILFVFFIMILLKLIFLSMLTNTLYTKNLQKSTYKYKINQIFTLFLYFV